jgi:hypothetical protein
VDTGECPQLLLTLGCQADQNAPGILRIGAPAYQFQLCHAVHQLDGGVMLDQQKLRNVADARGIRTGKALDGKQRLMLLRRQASPPRRGLTECQECPHLVAELCKGLIICIAHHLAA